MIELTDSAITHIMNNMDSRTDMLRIGLKPSGCAGFEYQISWTQAYNEQDSMIDYGKFKLVVDDMSVDYLKGSTLDVISEGINKIVKVINPQEINSCGCGASVQF